ncbi:MAG: hypothetical protein K2J47_06450, partial [Ruminococcus sp.]|nr:hypothetical protein [Ruminococcus sp.]
VSQDFTLSDDKRTITFTSGNSPVVFTRIPSGNYILHEVSAPVGYVVSENASVHVSQNDSISIEFTNTPTAVTFTKFAQNVDGTSSVFSGAVLELRYIGNASFDNIRSSGKLDINSSNKTISWTSSESDTVISGLPDGSYELDEIYTPDGFVSAETITFDINNGEVINAVNTFGEVIDNHIKIYNKKFQPKTVFQNEYITIYDSATKQNQFITHGLGVLAPTECIVTENANGKWELSITHPFDSDNKYQYIRENNIIKAFGQLFVLKTVAYSSGEKNEVTGKAEHIFYQQNDWWIFPDSEKILFVPNNSVLNLLDNIDAFSAKNIAPNQTHYDFIWDSDMTIPESYPLRVFPNSEGASPVSVIMDSGGILDITSGELYRDNFYFSIRKRMENSNDNAFEIRIGNNLRGIRRNIDITTVCTFFKGYDNYGNWFAVSWSDESVGSVGMPHSVIRSKKFSYTFDDESMSDFDKADTAAKLLEADTMLFFEQNCKPLISYEVDLEDVQHNPDFAEFNNKPDYRVGNIGVLYDERLNQKITLKITKTIKDAITGKTTSVIFGDNRSFTNNHGYNSAVIGFTPVIRSKSFQITDSSGAFVYDSENNAIVQEVTYE